MYALFIIKLNCVRPKQFQTECLPDMDVKTLTPVPMELIFTHTVGPVAVFKYAESWLLALANSQLASLVSGLVFKVKSSRMLPRPLNLFFFFYQIRC